MGPRKAGGVTGGTWEELSTHTVTQVGNKMKTQHHW